MANIVIRPYRLNVAPGGIETVVNLSQYENGRELVFHLVGEGQIVIPAGSTAIIAGTKPDDTIYSAVGYVDADENTVTFQENVQMTAAAGKWYAKVKVTASGQTVASGMVKFVVEKDVIPPEAEQSSSDIQGLIAEAAQYAEDARNSFANDARTMEFHELTTTDQTIIDALNELDADMVSVEADTAAVKQILSYTFSQTSSITSQADSFDDFCVVYGTIQNSSSVQTVVGLPLAASGRIEVKSYNVNFKEISYYPNGGSESLCYILKKNSGTWQSTWTQMPTRSEIDSLNSSLSNSFDVSELTSELNIPTSATSYSCNWSNYRLLIVCMSNYGNILGTTVVPNAYMNATTSTNRIILYTPSADKNWQIYKNGNSAVYIKASASDSSNGVRIYGVGKIS